MINQTLLDFVFYWLLPFSIAVGGFFLLVKFGNKFYKQLDLDRMWHFAVRVGIILGAILIFWVWFKSTGIPTTIVNYTNIAIQKAQQVQGIMKVWYTILANLSAFVAFMLHWTPVYVRAFVLVWTIGGLIEIQALIWRIRFVFALNVVMPAVVLSPWLAFKYFLGYKTPFFDFIHGRLFGAIVKENANDGWGYALRGVDDKGQKFENGVGGSVSTAKIQNAGLSVRWSKSSVITSGKTRKAVLIIRRSRETEADNLLKSNLQGLGRRLNAPNIRFQEDPMEDFEGSNGFRFDSEVDYDAGDNLGSWRTIFINPFTEEARVKSGGAGALATFEGVVIGMIQYLLNVTPVSVASKITASAKKRFKIDTSADHAKFKAQQNLDLSKVPTPRDQKTGNDIDTQREIALKVAKEREPAVTQALNANKIYGTFDGVVVGGNTAVYQYTLPRSANLPNDFAKIQDSVSNMLKMKDIPIIKLQAGALTVSVTNGVNIPVDFRDMVTRRNKGMSTLISGMAGVDALGENIYFELGDKNPHAMLFGKTGTGKTVTIMTILYSIMSAVDPTRLRIAYVDGKGNSFEFMRTDDPSNPDTFPNPFTYAQPADASGDIEYARALIKHIERETRRRIQLFKEAGVSKLADYNEKYPDKRLFEILFVVDEFSAITQQDKNLKASEMAEKGTVDTFEYIAKMSRSVGIRLLLANQSARKELVPGKISANVTGRVSLGVSEPIESEIALPDAKIAVHLLSQAGEFYSIMNGVRNPEHGNSPYLPDKVMHDLNNALVEKFGQIDYVITREEVLNETSGEPAGKATTPIPDPLPTVDTPIDSLLALVKDYPQWATENKASSVFKKNNGLYSVTPRIRKGLIAKIETALTEAEAKAKVIAESATADTRRSTGRNVSAEVGAITKGNNHVI